MGKTQLHEAAELGRKFELLQWLAIDESKINEQDESGCTALHYAVESGTVGCVEVLLQNGAKILADGNEETPIDYARKRGDQGIIKLLNPYDKKTTKIVHTNHKVIQQSKSFKIKFLPELNINNTKTENTQQDKQIVQQQIISPRPTRPSNYMSAPIDVMVTIAERKDIYTKAGFTVIAPTFKLKNIPLEIQALISSLLKAGIPVWLTGHAPRDLMFAATPRKYDFLVAKQKKRVIEFLQQHALQYTEDKEHIKMRLAGKEVQLRVIGAVVREEVLVSLKNQQLLFTINAFYLKFDRDEQGNLIFVTFCPQVTQDHFDKKILHSSIKPFTYFQRDPKFILETLIFVKNHGFTLSEHLRKVMNENAQCLHQFDSKYTPNYLAIKLKELFTKVDIVYMISQLQACGILPYLALPAEKWQCKSTSQPIAAKSLYFAIIKQEADKISELLATGASDYVNVIYADGWTTLDLAIWAGNVDCLCRLLLAGANITNQYDCGFPARVIAQENLSAKTARLVM